MSENKMKPEKAIQNKKEGKEKKPDLITKIKNDPHSKYVLAILIIAIIIVSIAFLNYENGRIVIEKAEITAPLITLSPAAPGILEKITVKEGDKVGKGKIVAIVGNKTIETKTKGIIVYVKNVPGQVVSSQDAIVKMFDPQELRLVGRIEENKGLKDIAAGQKVKFTVDAYDSKEYLGIVESIAETARQSDIVFSISDKRQEREFEVKARFDDLFYPELKNGMSAKMTIYK